MIDNSRQSVCVLSKGLLGAVINVYCTVRRGQPLVRMLVVPGSNCCLETGCSDLGVFAVFLIWKVSRFLSVPLDRCRNRVSLGYDASFLILPSSLCTYHSVIRPILLTASLIKQKIIYITRPVKRKSAHTAFGF